MSTEPVPSKDRLSPSWISRPKMWRRKSAQEQSLRPSTSSSFLSPRPTSSRSNSDTSRSVRSKSLDNRTSFREVVKRLRSSSSASSLGGGLREIDDNDIHDWFHGFRRYNQLVTTKFSQEPSYDPAAFSKATKKLTKNCGGNLIHGLPEAAFDFALLWCPTTPTSNRSSTEPSWSWTSHTGPVCLPFDPTTCPDISSLPKSTPLFKSEIKNFHIGPSSTPYTIRREKTSSALRTIYPAWFHAPHGSDHTVESSTLRFTAETMPADGFTSEQLHYKDAEIPVCQLFDPRNRHCGVIMSHLSSFSTPSSTGPYEFILLSRNLWREPEAHTRRPQNGQSHPPGTPIWDGQGFVWDENVVEFDDEFFQEGEWKVVNVMLVRWVGEYAERVAVGRMHEDVWREMEARRKEIVLR